VKEELEKAETDGLAPEKLGFNEDGVYDSADYRYGTVFSPKICLRSSFLAFDAQLT
jgi:hypothetical protein